jgi:hypothetical protein
MNNGLIGAPTHVKRAVDALSQHMFRVPAAGPIRAGELVTMLENGKVAKTSASLTSAQENNTTSGPVALRAASASTSANYGMRGQEASMCVLSNGSIAELYSGDGSTVSDRVTLRIRNAQGGDEIATIVTSDSNVWVMRPLPLVDGVLVVWTSSNILKFAIYTSAGVLVTAATTVITTLSNNTSSSIGAAVSKSGEFILSYDKQTSRDCVFKRYSSLGVLQGSEVVVEASAQADWIAVLPCANGEFVVSYRASASTSNKFGRFSSAGVMQGSLVTIIGSSVTTSNGVNPAQSVAELSNGNIVMQAAPNSDSRSNLYVYTPANVLVATVDVISGKSNALFPVCVLPNSFCVASYVSNATYVQLNDNNGSQLLPQTITGITAQGDESESSLIAFSTGVGVALLRTGFNSGSGNYDIKLGVVDVVGNAVGSVVVVQVATATPNRYTSACMSASGVLQFQYLNGTSVYYGAYKCMKSSVIGVACNGGELNDQITFSTKGSFTLPPSQAFLYGGAFDNRQAAVPGTRGVVAGNTANLFGMDNYG